MVYMDPLGKHKKTEALKSSERTRLNSPKPYNLDCELHKIIGLGFRAGVKKRCRASVVLHKSEFRV